MNAVNIAYYCNLDIRGSVDGVPSVKKSKESAPPCSNTDVEKQVKISTGGLIRRSKWHCCCCDWWLNYKPPKENRTLIKGAVAHMEVILAPKLLKNASRFQYSNLIGWTNVFGMQWRHLCTSAFTIYRDRECFGVCVIRKVASMMSSSTNRRGCARPSAGRKQSTKQLGAGVRVIIIQCNTMRTILLHVCNNTIQIWPASASMQLRL